VQQLGSECQRVHLSKQLVRHHCFRFAKCLRPRAAVIAIRQVLIQVTPLDLVQIFSIENEFLPASHVISRSFAWLLLLTANAFHQGTPAAVYPGLNRAHWRIERNRDFLIRLLF